MSRTFSSDTSRIHMLYADYWDFLAYYTVNFFTFKHMLNLESGTDGNLKVTTTPYL